METRLTDKIEVSGEFGRKMHLTINGNIAQLDIEKDFLKPLEDKDGTYIGTGMLLSACAYFYKYTGNKSLFDLRCHLLKRILESQDSNGYIGHMKDQDRIWRMFDVDETSQFIMGLVDDYLVFNESSALDAVKKLSMFVIRQYRNNPDKIPGDGKYDDILASLLIDNALFSVYEITNDESMLDFLINHRKLLEWKLPIIKGRWGKISGHAYSYIAKCLAQLKLFRIYPDSRLLQPTQRLVKFLLKEDGMVVTGAISFSECWHDNQDGGRFLGETCANSYLLSLLYELVKIDNKPIWGDMMERIIYNALFAAQSIDGRKLRYYTPLNGQRTFWDKDTYCCPNNFRKTMSALPKLIYHVNKNNIHVNLYNTSEYSTIMENGINVTVRQVTDYPTTGKVQLYLEPSEPAIFTLSLRIPIWCKRFALQINDEPLTLNNIESGQNLAIRRLWQKDDCLDLSLEMPLVFIKGRKSQEGKFAIMRGPLLFCLSMDRNKDLTNTDLEELVVDPNTIDGPYEDNTIRPAGLSYKILGWVTPFTNNSITLHLSEYTDPQGVLTYFKPKNPMNKYICDDKLLHCKHSFGDHVIDLGFSGTRSFLFCEIAATNKA